MTTLRKALADQSEQALEMVEPVAWMVYTLDGKSAFVTDNPKDFTQDHRALPLYTHPPQRKPLTLEIHQPNESGSTRVTARWFVDTPHGWIGAWDREALEYILKGKE